MATTGKFKNPSWWTAEHETAWGKIRHSVQEGWQKMKRAAHSPADHKDGHVEAGLGESETAVRYGYGAGKQYGAATGAAWKTVEPQLQKEWESLGTGREWHHARNDVLHGWETHTRHLREQASPTMRPQPSGLGESPAGDSGSGSGPGF